MTILPAKEKLLKGGTNMDALVTDWLEGEGTSAGMGLVKGHSGA